MWITCAKLVGLSNEQIAEAIKSFKVPAHRFEFVTEKEGVKFADLPADWKCPTCKQPKEKFKELDKLITLMTTYSRNGIAIIENHLDSVEKICRKFVIIAGEI